MPLLLPDVGQVRQSLELVGRITFLFQDGLDLGPRLDFGDTRLRRFINPRQGAALIFAGFIVIVVGLEEIIFLHASICLEDFFCGLWHSIDFCRIRIGVGVPGDV